MFKRLKIVEQIIIISLIGVLVPSVISGFIVNNLLINVLTFIMYLLLIIFSYFISIFV